jgi:hypothetical protein
MVFAARPQKIKLNHIQKNVLMKNKKINRSVKIKQRNNNQKLADNSLLWQSGFEAAGPFNLSISHANL